MIDSLLLTPVEKSGRRVYKGVLKRTLRKTGGSFMTTFSKDVLELLGIVDQDELVDDDIEVTQHYMIFPDRGEMIVQERIPIQDASALRERIGDRDELVVDPEIVPEPAD